MTQVNNWTGESGDGVCIGGDTPKTQTTHEITMFRRFIPNPQGKAFQPSKKIQDIVEASKVDASELEEKTPLDPDIESKLIWRHFNIIKPGENVDERGRIQGTYNDDYIHGTEGADTILIQENADGVGSAAITSSGSAHSASAMTTLWRMPPEN